MGILLILWIICYYAPPVHNQIQPPAQNIPIDWPGGGDSHLRRQHER